MGGKRNVIPETEAAAGSTQSENTSIQTIPATIPTPTRTTPGITINSPVSNGRVSNIRLPFVKGDVEGFLKEGFLGLLCIK